MSAPVFRELVRFLRLGRRALLGAEMRHLTNHSDALGIAIRVAKYWPRYIIGCRIKPSPSADFIPLDVFKNANRTRMGEPVSEKTLSDRTRLTESGARHILGIQGQLWGENLRSGRGVEYLGFPRIIALAERAWARSPDWRKSTIPQFVIWSCTAIGTNLPIASASVSCRDLITLRVECNIGCRHQGLPCAMEDCGPTLCFLDSLSATQLMELSRMEGQHYFTMKFALHPI